MTRSALAALIVPTILFTITFSAGIADAEGMFYFLAFMTFFWVGPISIIIALFSSIAYAHFKRPVVYGLMMISICVSAFYIGGIGYALA